MANSIFTKIIKGEIPCHKVYEDEKTFAFLDIHPVMSGHTLVVPKTEVEYLWDLSDADYEALMATVKKVGKRIREVVGGKYVGMKVEGLGVPHTHVHVFPFNTEDEYYKRPDMQADPDHTALAAMAEKLKF